MNMLEAMQVADHEKSADQLLTKLRSDDVPFQVRNEARAVANQMEVIDDALDAFRVEVPMLPNYFVDRNYTPEGALSLTVERNVEVIRRNDPSRAIDILEKRVNELLSDLAERSKPLPPTPDPALLQSLLLGARQDAALALGASHGDLPEAILNLQTEALENGEDGLAYLLGATEWPVRYVKANGTPEDENAFERIRGTLRDNVSDPRATPYRQAAERLAELDEVPDGYRAAWKWAVEESGLLLPEVEAALGLT